MEAARDGGAAWRRPRGSEAPRIPAIGQGRSGVGLAAGLDLGSGDEGDRTLNLLVANQALSQLSYVPEAMPWAP